MTTCADPSQRDDLIARAQAGDREAEGQLIRRYMPHVRQKMIRWFPSECPISDDAMQEATIGIMEAVREYDPARRSRFVSFLNKCVYNQVLSHLQSERGISERWETNRMDGFEVSTPEDRTPPAIPSLDCLDDRQRMVIEMRFGLGREPQSLLEIAQELGVTSPRAHQILQEALERLRILNSAK